MHMPRLSVSFAALLIVAAQWAAPLRAAAADADQYNRNWPQWRGPAGNGLVLHGNPPLAWSEERNVKWKVPIPGSGHATPVIWEDKIFILSAIPSEGDGGKFEFTVFCLDRRTGQTRWHAVARIDSSHQEIQPTNSHSSGSPVTDGEHLVVSFGSYGLYCYDLGGNRLWEKDLGKVSVTWGEGSSPALAGNVVIVVQDNNAQSFVYGFDVRTGDELWKKPRDEGSSWTTPLVHERDGRTQVIINGAGAVRSYDPQTGDLLWQCSGLGVNVTPMVVVDDDTVYAMSGRRTSPAAMAIRLGGSGDLTGTDAVRWKVNRGTPYVASPLLYDGRLFFVQHVTPILTCLNAATGEPHFAERRMESLAGVYASPIGVNDRVYFVGREGTTLVLANSDELTVLAENQLDDGFDASPAVVGNELFLRGRTHLYCLAEE
jgi:outer membrane protein assembly factor BamB